MAQPVELPPFQRVWNDALKDYQAQMKQIGQAADLENWKNVRDVEDLIGKLEAEHGSFDTDVGRGSGFTSALKTGFAPVTLLMNMLGGPASAAFAPCSQIFGAVSVLIAAGKSTGAAFNDIGELFKDLGESTQLIKVLAKRTLPPELESIIRGILVCLLGVCALATKRTCHVPEKSKHRSLKQVMSGVKSNVSEFGRQLLFNADPDISAAKANLQRLTQAEARMVPVLTLEKVGEIQEGSNRIESLVVETRGLSFEISSAVYELQTETAGVSIKLMAVQETISKMDFTLTDIRENMVTKTEATANHKELLAQGDETQKALKSISTFQEQMAAGLRQLGSGGLTKPSKKELPKTALLHAQRLKELKKLLSPTTANNSHYSRYAGELMEGTGEWCLQLPEVNDWLDGKQSLLCINGETGFGKTFLATRIVKHLHETYKQGVQSPSLVSVGYFFCKRELKELRSVPNMIRTVAYHLAHNNRAYRAYVDGVKDETDLAYGTAGELWRVLFEDFFDEDRSPAYIVIDALDECEDDDDDYGIGAFLAAIKTTTERGGEGWPSKLRLLLMVNTGILEKVKLNLADNAKFLTLERDGGRADVAKVVEKKMSDAWSHRLVSKKLYNDVKETVLSASQGNFLWTSLMIDDLTSLSREDVIRARLQNLPVDVESAMILVLRRLSSRLDRHGIEDLNDLLAWVGCSHLYPSLATLDAVLTMRQPTSARVVDLDELIDNDFAGVFITSAADEGDSLPSAQRIQARLGEDSGAADDGVDDTVSVEDFAAGGTHGGGRDVHDNVPSEAMQKDTDLISELDRKLSGWSKITVRLGHSLIGRFIEEKKVEEGLKEFSTDRMHVKVLLGCLKAMCDFRDDPDTIKRANNYAALYLPEQLNDVDAQDVEQGSKQEIALLILKLLRDDSALRRWIKFATRYMVKDLLSNDDFVMKLLSWLQAEEVRSTLSAEDNHWISAATEKPFEVLFEPLARAHATLWLVTDEVEDIDCSLAFLTQWLTKVSKLDTPSRHKSTSVDTCAEQIGYLDKPPREIGDAGGLDTAEFEAPELEIVRAARWATLNEDARWHQRVGYILRLNDHHKAAKKCYEYALKLDPDLPRAHSGLAAVYMSYGTLEGWKLATLDMEKAVESLGRLIDTPDGPETQLEWWQSDFRLNLGWLATYYNQIDEPAKADDASKRLLEGWEDADKAGVDDDMITGAVYYLQTLIQREYWERAADVFKRFVEHPRRDEMSFHIMYTTWIEQPTLLLQVAYKTGTFDVLDRFWNNALQVCARYGVDGEVAAVRFVHSLAILRLCPDRTDDAVVKLRKVVMDPEVATPSSYQHWVKERAERELARIYLDRAVQAREDDKWGIVGDNVSEMNKLCKVVPDADQSEIVDREASSILAAWYTLNGQRKRAAHSARPKLLHGINVLTDDNPANDLEAWQCFGDASLAVGGIERAAAAVGMQKQLCIFGASEIEGVTQKVEEPVDDGEEGEAVKETSSADTMANGTTPAAEEPAATAGAESSEESTLRDITTDKPDNDLQPVVNGVVAPPPQDASIEMLHSTPNHTMGDPMVQSNSQVDSNGEDMSPVVDDAAPTIDQPNGTSAETDSSAVDVKEEPAEDGTTPEETTENDQTMSYGCDGPCFKPIPNEDVFHRCSYCISDFCGSCHQLLQEGRMEGFSVCSSSHQRYEMPGVSQRFGKDMIRVGDQEVLIEKWLKELKIAWDIPVAS